MRRKKRRMDRAFPSNCGVFSFPCFSFVLCMTSGVEGRSWGYPTMTAQAGPEVGMG